VNASRSSAGFGRWAVTGVIAPVVVILILRFAVAPFAWGPDIASDLGSALGGIFIVWLLLLSIAATLWKIRSEKTKGGGK
jgi:hypothetical protein